MPLKYFSISNINGHKTLQKLCKNFARTLQDVKRSYFVRRVKMVQSEYLKNTPINTQNYSELQSNMQFSFC